jgi:hypothetical protein
MTLPAKPDLQSLSMMVVEAFAVAEAYDKLKSEVEKNIRLLELDVARKRRSRSAAAKIDLVALKGMLQAYQEVAAMMEKQR